MCRLEAKLKAKDAVNPGGGLALPQPVPNNFIGPLEPRSAHHAGMCVCVSVCVCVCVLCVCVLCVCVCVRVFVLFIIHLCI